jgi:segregation and condensation protein A
MEAKRLELAADYLLMAAMLAEIKSRMLLPVTASGEEEIDEDPRMALVRRLQAYEQMKHAAELLDTLPRLERDHFIVQIQPNELEAIKTHPDVTLTDLIQAMGSLLQKEDRLTHHQIAREVLSVRERMNAILMQLEQHKVLDFSQLYTVEEGRTGLVVSLLAILELARQSLIIITQTQEFAPIHLQAA